MELLVEWSPLIIFFLSFKLFGIYWATAALMLGCCVPLVWHRLRTGRFKTMHLITLGVALALGTATLLLHDARFIQLKPTVLLGLTAAAFLGSTLLGRRPLAQRLLESVFEQPLAVSAGAWTRLNIAWSAWFALLAAANLYVARHFSESVWVNFKLFGIGAAMMLFMIPQVIWLSGRSAGASA